jgi:hypothetical protein
VTLFVTVVVGGGVIRVPVDEGERAQVLVAVSLLFHALPETSSYGEGALTIENCQYSCTKGEDSQ